LISWSIEHNWTFPLKVNGGDKKLLDNVIPKLKSFEENFNFISEKEIKFSLFGNMITAIPDLVLTPKRDETFMVWDFKTGAERETKTIEYWFQLQCYAYALYQNKYIKFDQPIKLVIYYVDELKVLEKETSYNEVRDELYSIWKKLACLSQVNLAHCSECEFKSICHKG